jgi:hypothetical protein
MSARPLRWLGLSRRPRHENAVSPDSGDEAGPLGFGSGICVSEGQSAMASEELRPAGRSKVTSAVALVLLATGVGAMGWIGTQLFELHDNATFAVTAPCRVCGRVERVRELERASPAALPLNGDQSESIVMMIAALGGRIASSSAAFSFRTFETAVRLDDGSVRIVRDTSEPPWKPGDRVRVMRGRVEPMAS